MEFHHLVNALELLLKSSLPKCWDYRRVCAQQCINFLSPFQSFRLSERGYLLRDDMLLGWGLQAAHMQTHTGWQSKPDSRCSLATAQLQKPVYSLTVILKAILRFFQRLFSWLLAPDLETNYFRNRFCVCIILKHYVWSKNLTIWFHIDNHNCPIFLQHIDKITGKLGYQDKVSWRTLLFHQIKENGYKQF